MEWRRGEDKTEGISRKGLTDAQLLKHGRKNYQENYCKKYPPPYVKNSIKKKIYYDYLFRVMNMKLDAEPGEYFNVLLHRIAWELA